VSFFAGVPVPEPPAEPEYRPPPWMVPPDNVLPAAVPLDALVVADEHLAVWVEAALAYPEGVTLDFTLVRRERPGPGRPSMPFFATPSPGEAGGPRFGVGFADGRKAVLGVPPGRGPVDAATRAILSPLGGGGSHRRWQSRLWLWPLPPPGPLTFAFAWLDEGVDEATVAVDAAPILAATARAREIWPDDRPLRDGAAS
jgi:hypothetical protein